MNSIKKFTALLCAVAMFISGIVVISTEAKAEDAGIYDQVEYDASYSIADYWTTNTKTAPVKQGYVFGGWYTKPEDTYIALEEGNITTDEDGKASVADTVYAKFVPAHVLSVKAQNESGTAENDGQRASVRIASAVDSTAYQKVGFNILINNKNKLYKDTANKTGELESASVYRYVKAGDESYSAEQIFGAPAQYFNVWNLTGIADANDAKIINVTPYWITLDGTKVEGVSKYVHIEDGYKGYISVPVSLNVPQEVAAGTVTITYPDGMTLVEDKVEFNGVFPGAEATFSVDTKTRTIKIVGNAETVDSYNVDKKILVNLRFTADSSKYPGIGKGTFLSFSIENEVFYNWEEKPVVIDVWDVQY